MPGSKAAVPGMLQCAPSQKWELLQQCHDRQFRLGGLLLLLQFLVFLLVLPQFCTLEVSSVLILSSPFQ